LPSPVFGVLPHQLKPRLQSSHIGHWRPAT